MRTVTDKFDQVTAITDKAPCVPAKVKADTETRRHADLYLSKKEATNPASFFALGSSGAHEDLHLKGVAHAGRLKGKDNPTLPNLRYLELYGIADQAPVNLKEYFSDYDYDEYGDFSNIMGDALFNQPDWKPRPNPIQMDSIRWPEARIHGDKVLSGREVKESLTISPIQARNGEYGFVNLGADEAFTLKDPVSYDATGGAAGGVQKLDRLAFLPVLAKDAPSSMELFLTTSGQIDKPVIDIGTVYFENRPNSIIIGQRLLTIDRTAKNYTIKVNHR